MIENPTHEQLKTLTMIIYMIVNKVNGKKYIGKAMKTFKKRYPGCRWWENPANQHIKHSVEKYGLENFHVSILEYNVKSRKELCKLEKHYIKELNTLYPNGYNYLKGGENFQYTNELKELIVSKKRKQYIFYDNLQEKIIYVDNLPKFCKDNNLLYGSMRAICNGKGKRKLNSHKHFSDPNLKLRKWSILSPDDKIYNLMDGEIRPFCKKMKIDRRTFVQVLTGRFRQHQGWRLPSTILLERKIKSPNGEIFTIKEGCLRKFCRKHGLKRHNGICCVLLGQIKSSDGWTLP